MNDSKLSSSQIAYESIKEWILSGFLPPGEKIDQDEVASKLNFSRMPVRSALDRLSSEGLVMKIPHRGVVTSKLSDTELNQIFELRAHVESMIGIQAARYASESSIRRLYNILQYHQDSPDASMAAILEQNRAFHRMISLSTESDVLLKVFDIVWEQAERYRRIYYYSNRSNARVIKEHRQIADLIAAHRPQEVSDLIIQHTANSQKAILELMNKPFSFTPFRTLYVEENDGKGNS